MKRLLLESTKAVPYTPGQAADRLGALSGVLGLSVTAADADAVATITVTHCDTEGDIRGRAGRAHLPR